MTNSNDEQRDGRGRFVNFAGPGRPRRAVELDFVRDMSDTITRERWRAIVGKVAELAEGGERWAVETVARWVMGSSPPALFDVAIRDELGLTSSDAEVIAEARRAQNPSPFAWGNDSPLERAAAVRDELARTDGKRRTAKAERT